jgi:hypothetical protein
MLEEKKKKEWLNEKELAKELNISFRTLQKWRQRGVGPPYHKVAGKLIKYYRPEVDEYFNLTRRTTDQKGRHSYSTSR